MASDSVYQINLEDKNTPFLATERDRYSAVMGDCLFLTDQHLYLRRQHTSSGKLRSYVERVDF